MKFIGTNKECVDSNTQEMVFQGQLKRVWMSANQIYYRSLRNMKKEEYVDDFNHTNLK